MRFGKKHARLGLAICAAVVAWTLVAFVYRPAIAQDGLPVDQLKAPPGFTVTLVAHVRNARAMTLGSGGTLFVGSGNAGAVYAVTLPADGKSEGQVRTIATKLQSPAGIAFHNGALYVSAIDRILRFDDIEQHLADPPAPVVVTDRLPSEAHHGVKFIAFGPDGKLYANVGSPCNVCENDARHGVIVRMNPDGSAFETFARGVRNSVGFDWDPRTRELWFTDNGRDSMGDDVPGDELDHAPRPGMNFGFPYCHAGTVPDPEFGSRHRCDEFTPPAQVLGAHVASLGMRFYTGSQFPAAYRNQVFIAEHGSWNRSSKSGYRVTVVKLDASGRAVSYEPFVTGWLQSGGSTWGRPADVLVAPDGSLLVSDDTAGAVYRVRYTG